MKRESFVILTLVVALFGVSTTLSLAQQKQTPDRERVERDATIERQQDPAADLRFKVERDVEATGEQPGDFVFLATEMSFGGKVVKGAPYSAQAVTESVQTLNDGNRIVSKSTAAIYRDSEGRTRREQTLRGIGGFATGGEAPQTVFISDPVAATTYLLNPGSHTARKMPAPATFQFKMLGPAREKSESFETSAPEPGARARADRVHVEIDRSEAGMRMSSEPTYIWGWGNHTAKNESLGKQNMEGVEAEGTRSTVTIPAGEVGNDRPIEIVNERWYSPELQVVVMTRHSDPRFGESSYRLTNIDRSEPARSLFELPADYAVKSGPGMPGEASARTVTTFRPAGAIGAGVLNGKAIKLPLPAYPAIAKAAQASGNVEVEVTIDEDGNVIAARSVSGHPLLQAAAVTAAREAKFAPTRLSGQPVKVQGMLVYTFAAQ